MKRKIAVGVVGCGYWGPLLVRNFKSLPDCQLKAVCDLNAARLKHVGTLYPDIEGMTQTAAIFNGSNLDAVVIAAPVQHHYSLAKAACSQASIRSLRSRWPRLPPSARN